MSNIVETRQFVSTSKQAFNSFGFPSNFITNSGKFKNIFMVKFNVNTTIAGIEREVVENLSFVVKSIDKPKYSMDVQTLNQYNKKRLIYQQIEYQATTLHFYDTYKSDAAIFLKEYLNYYFADFSKTSVSDWNDDIIKPEFNNGDKGWGFTPKDDQYFINSIEVFQIYGKRTYDKYTYVHPKIQSLDFDTNDFSVNDISEITMGFMSEGVIVENGKSWLDFGNDLGERNHGDLKTEKGSEKIDPMNFKKLSEVPNAKEAVVAPPKISGIATLIQKTQLV